MECLFKDFLGSNLIVRSTATSKTSAVTLNTLQLIFTHTVGWAGIGFPFPRNILQFGSFSRTTAQKHKKMQSIISLFGCNYPITGWLREKHTRCSPRQVNDGFPQTNFHHSSYNYFPVAVKDAISKNRLIAWEVSPVIRWMDVPNDRMPI